MLHLLAAKQLPPKATTAPRRRGLVFVDFDDILFRDGWVVCEVWVDRWVEGEGKGGV
jgi:hypothetical protein